MRGMASSTSSASWAPFSRSARSSTVTTDDKFLRAANLLSVSRQASYYGIMAVGMVFVISMGDVDLSLARSSRL